jgi:phosphoribosylformimino-5-aminoimidazole carboxamide ribonucleotide (ProFAR) isomerase
MSGKAVQLVHGRKRELTVADVFGLLEKFKSYPWLHLIDLDAAIGTGDNDNLIAELCKKARTKFKLKVRVGGGIRTVARAKEVANFGATQIVIGSAAFQKGKINKPFLRRLSKAVPRKKIVIALDTAKGKIATHGWRQRQSFSAEGVMSQLEPFCSGFLCTDVDREGTMTGANLNWFHQLRTATTYPIIAAGGIKTRREVTALEKIGMDAAVGMAVYKNKLR